MFTKIKNIFNRESRMTMLSTDICCHKCSYEWAAKQISNDKDLIAFRKIMLQRNGDIDYERIFAIYRGYES